MKLNISGCYFDFEISGLAKTDDMAKSTSDMKKQSTYVGWDFTDVWAIDEDSYPMLRLFL